MDERDLAICDQVELLAAVCALSPAADAGEVAANPWLRPALGALARREDHLAFSLVRRFLKVMPRDMLIKGLVHALAGSPEAMPHGQMLARALADLAKQALPDLQRELAGVRRQMVATATPLLQRLDPVGEIAETCREPLPIRLCVSPSLFLPLPQEGRHGVMLPRAGGEFNLFMFFGLPLERGLAEVGITRAWLRRGGWFYAIRLFLARHEARYADVLRAVGQEGEIATFRNHLAIALRWGPWRREGLSQGAFELLAEAQGLRLSPWFVEAVDRYLAGSEPLADHLPAMARSYVAALPSLREMAARPMPAPPPIISCCLLPLWASGAKLVAPEPWLQPGHPDLPLLQRTSQGLHLRLDSHWDGGSGILCGSVDHPAIKPVLDAHRITAAGRRIQWGKGTWAGDSLTLYALETDGADWRLVITGPNPESMARPRLSQLMLLPYSAALYRGERMVQGYRENRGGHDLADLLI